MRVFINPTYTGLDRADGGIRRVVEAQQKYLPQFGWEIASSPDEADLIANHGASLEERPGVPMVNRKQPSHPGTLLRLRTTIFFPRRCS